MPQYLCSISIGKLSSKYNSNFFALLYWDCISFPPGPATGMGGTAGCRTGSSGGSRTRTRMSTPRWAEDMPNIPLSFQFKTQSRTSSMRVHQCLQNFTPIPSSAFSGHDDFNPPPASNTPLSFCPGRPCWIAHRPLIVATPCAGSVESCPLPLRGRSGSRGSGAWTPRRTPPGRRSSRRTSP